MAVIATRRERVILELEDRFSGQMTRAIAATEAMRRSLHDLDGSAVRTSRSQQQIQRDIDRTGDSARRAGTDIDSFSGRLGVLVRLAAALGPALVPIGAALVPAISGLAVGFTAVAAAGGTAMLAFQGVGDSLKALNDFQAEPTAANLEKMREEFDKLGPAGEQFVRHIDSLAGELDTLQRAAGEGLFPGLETGIDELMTTLPGVRDFVREIGSVMGGLSSDAAGDLTGSADWQAFFDYMKTDAAPTLDAFARSLGNFAAGFANMLTGLAPLSRDFTSGMLDMSRSFRDWSAGLSDNEGFQEFIDYVRESGPIVGDFFGSLVDLLGELTQAVAPWGSAVLPILTATADAFAALADSPIGSTLATAAIGMAALGRASSMLAAPLGRMQTGLTNARTGIVGFGQAARTIPGDMVAVSRNMLVAGAASERMAASSRRLNSSLAVVGRGVATVGPGLAAMTALSTGAADKMGLTNTATLALAGSMAGPWGAAAGATVGLLSDMAASSKDVTNAMDAFDASLRGGATLTQLNADLSSSKQELAEWKDAVSDGRGALAVLREPTDFLKSSKDFFEGMFGKSETEELQERYDAAADKANNLRDAARGLADAYGITITATKGSSAETQQLSTILEEARPAMQALGITTEDLQKAAANGTLPKLVAQIEAYGDGSTKSAAAQRGLKQSIEEATNAMKAQNDEALAAIDAQVAFEQAVDDAQKAAVAGAGFNADTEGGRTNLTQASSVAAKFNALPDATIGQYNKAAAAIQAIGDKAGASDKRIRELQTNLVKPAVLQITDNSVEFESKVKALGEFLKGFRPKVMAEITTNGIPRTKRELDELDRDLNLTTRERRALVRLMGVPKTKAEAQEIDGLLVGLGNRQAEPKVAANIKPFLGAHATVTADLNSTGKKTVTPTVRLRNQASGPLSVIRSEMANLRDKTVTLTVQRRVVGAAIQIGAMAAAAAGQADGGTVTGAPRQPYGDKVLTFLAPGEEVVSNRHGQADRHRPLLKAINANALADGGTVTRLADGGRVPETTSRSPRATGLAAGDPHAPVRAGAMAAEQSLKGLAKQVKASERAVEREQKERDKVAEQLQATRESQRALSSTVAEGLRSDLWNQEAGGNVFGRMTLGTDPRQLLRADIADARRFSQLQARLRNRGISDSVLESVAAEGGIEGLEQIGSYSRSEVRQLNRLYATRQRLTGAAGRATGQIVYGDEVASQTRELKAQTRELREAKQHQRGLERKVDRLEKAIRQKAKTDDKSRGKHGKDTAKETGKQVRNAGARGARNKRYAGK